MTLAPGHFHAALAQKQMAPGVHPRAYVYAPLGDDLLAHLERVAAFNRRPDEPTAWELDVRAGSNYLARFVQEQPGNAVVIAGRNRPKIDLILAALRQNLPVLADKPWVIDAADFPKLEEVLRETDLREVAACDMLTERFEVTNALQRELMRDPDAFGAPLAGTPEEPGLVLESTHYLKKTVAGAPLRRPAWWFDPAEAGDALADVGTHLADLALWLLFPDRPIDYRRDAHVLDATCWPTPLSREQFAALTGRPDFPAELAPRVANGQLLYHGNGTATCLVRGVHVRFTTLWDYEAPDGRGDSHEATARGTRARVETRGGEVFATARADHAALVGAVARRCERLRDQYPGLGAIDHGDRVQLAIPDALRVGHEAHFAAVVREFAHYFHNPRHVPPCERANLLTRYHLTTQAVALARRKHSAPEA